MNLAEYKRKWPARLALLVCLGWPMADGAYAANQAAVLTSVSSDAAVPAGMRLERTVLVMRHGVRAATDTRKMNALSAQPWPAFDVADGELTPHGYQAIVALGQWERAYFAEQGLIMPASCPSDNAVFIWASPLSRTQKTAEAWREGVLPGCQLAIGHVDAEHDTLFHPKDGDAGSLNPRKTRDAILAAMGSPEAARQRYADDAALMARVVGMPADCTAAHGATHCGINASPWGVEIRGGKAKLTGPASAGASMSETIRMEYADGWPLERVAFGAVHNSNDVIRLMGLRSAKYEYGNHVPYIAQRGGSQLLNQIALALDGKKHEQGGPPDARLLVFVGHDTNIAQLRTLLHFDWQIGSYRENDAVPGGTLMFERFVRERDGARFIRLSYLAQSLDQIRSLDNLTTGNGPLRAFMSWPEVGSNLVPLGIFAAHVRSNIDRAALADQAYNSISK